MKKKTNKFVKIRERELLQLAIFSFSEGLNALGAINTNSPFRKMLVEKFKKRMRYALS